MGLFDRGDRDIVPLNYLSDCWNCSFPNEGGVRSRWGSELSQTFANIKRFHMYKRIGEVDRYLILNNVGQLFDTANLVDPLAPTPILTIAAMTDFSVAVLFNRAYISPHNGQTGLAGEKIYVYEGTGVARVASGTAPTAYAITATVGAAGKVDKGKRLFAVAYETASGHITKYGPEPFVQYEDVTGAHKVNLSGIAVGPAGTVYKHILATHAAPTNWDGNVLALTFYFIPEGKIDNATTVYEFDNYDSQLSDSADYLANQLATIPAALGIVEFGGRLLAWNFNDKNYLLRGSEVDKPESFNDLDGFTVVNPGDGGGITNIVPDMRGAIFIHKDQRTYTTQDNGSPLNTWSVDRLDVGKGTPSPWGAGKVLDTQGASTDYYILADRGGLYSFTGTFSEFPLSYDIEAVWNRINPLAFHRVQVVLDPIKRFIYVAVPLDAAVENSHVLFADCQLGASFDRVRWSIWQLPQAVNSIACDVKFDTKRTFFRYTGGSNIYQVRESLLNDYGNLITAYTESALVGESDDSEINQFGGIVARIVGSGILNINLYGVDRVQTAAPTGIVLSALPGKTKSREFDFHNEKMSVRLGVNSINDWFYWTKLSIYKTFLWADEPN